MAGRLYRFALFAALLVHPIAGARAGDVVGWRDLANSSVSTGSDVVIDGFLLPADVEGDRVYQFVLVPWPGACSHTKPPPPEQVVLVTPDQSLAVTGNYEPVSVRGQLVQRREISQFYIIDGIMRLESGYRIKHAVISSAAARMVAPPPQKPRAPWEFLRDRAKRSRPSGN